MTRGRRGPAPARGIGPQEAPAKKPQRRHSADDDRQPTGGELLRQLARHVRKGTDPADAREWQRVAAEVATPVVNGGRLDRTAAVTVLSLAAQAAGVGQANAFGVIWRALWGAR